jgi:D-galactarolactone cycloisomerase
MSSRIARIETFLFRAEVNEPVKTSFGSIPRRSALLLRVEDHDGAHGWGEVWCNFPPYSADNKMRLFETVIAPATLAIEYSSPSDAWHTLTARTSRWASQGGEPGPFAACIAGVDLALWDMAARRAGKPLRALLAGMMCRISCRPTRAVLTQTRRRRPLPGVVRLASPHSR